MAYFGAASAPNQGNIATSPATTSAQQPQPFASTSASTPASKLRSCLVCRTRKVRCDKQSPCSNCRKANVPCVVPPTDRPPRWARRIERLATNGTAASRADPGVTKVLDRLQSLENLVKELSGQLEETRAATSSLQTQSCSAETKESFPAVHLDSLHDPLGRLVIQNANRSRYVSSGFWTRVDHELEELKMDTHGLRGDVSDSSEDERTPSQHHAFLFRHNLSTTSSNLAEFRPLPSQAPFLLDIFAENVNFFMRIVHLPTVAEKVRSLRGGTVRLTLPDEALLFSIYYAAVISMEEDDVMSNFGTSKSELALKYRLGLEHALAEADFLNSPATVYVQAFALFLLLARRHESPGFVYMMTGLVIRMAQYLGLHRDGTHFAHLSPFEIEARRQLWWAVCMLDVRASEDQGTALTIASDSFDTKIPSNINDVDINPEMKTMPPERPGVTDNSFARIAAGITHIHRQLMATNLKHQVANLEGQDLLLNKIYHKFVQEYLQFATDSTSITCWVAVNVARLIMAKLTLMAFLPVLFSSPSEQFSENIRIKLLVKAIEVAEYNHALNAEQACRKWRWVFQTRTHWHAIVYNLIEICRRPWGPSVERAWVALQSNWLIPARTLSQKNSRMWIPLRKLMKKARKHREAELDRLRSDTHAAIALAREDQKIPLPSSASPLSPASSAEKFRERWRNLVTAPMEQGVSVQKYGNSNKGLAEHPTHSSNPYQPTESFRPMYNPAESESGMPYQSHYFGTEEQQIDQTFDHTTSREQHQHLETTITLNDLSLSSGGQTFDPTILGSWPDEGSMDSRYNPSLWTDVNSDLSADVFSNVDVGINDAGMDMNSEVNWYDWIESAKSME